MRLKLSLHLQHNHPLENHAEPAQHHQIINKVAISYLQEHIFRAAPHILRILDHPEVQKHEHQHINAIFGQCENESRFEIENLFPLKKNLVKNYSHVNRDAPIGCSYVNSSFGGAKEHKIQHDRFEIEYKAYNSLKHVLYVRFYKAIVDVASKFLTRSYQPKNRDPIIAIVKPVKY
jgi:hypothetical protein